MFVERRKPHERKRLPETRSGTTLKFKIVAKDGDDATKEVKGYIQTGEYEDGTLGEIFVKIGKAGSSEAVFDEWATAASIALQYGAPVSVILGKHAYTQFEPSGAVIGVPGITRCTSPLDLIARFLISKYTKGEE
jgi:ribonucleoside-diphosphate reductase alpha chain